MSRTSTGTQSVAKSGNQQNHPPLTDKLISVFLLTQTSEADNRANARGAIENDVTITLYFDLFNPYLWEIHAFHWL